MKPEAVKGIPYGVSDYSRIRQRNYYYVDKTPFLDKIEKAGDYLFLIRPRRFGKSLFIAIMESYYDVLNKDRFEELFKGTWIYEHPTEERSQYLTLVLNFSAVESDPDKLDASFLSHVKGNAVAFVQRYSAFLSNYKEFDYYAQAIKESHSASDILSSLLTLCKEAGQKLYVLIDEYDNFSNTILSTIGKDAYQNLTHGVGFFRSFFNILKSGTTRMDSPISRLFITGVFPIIMDDGISGFNIGKDISFDSSFNQALGFTTHNVIEMIEYYRANGLIKHSAEYLLDIMTEWYGNYLFSEYVDGDITMFNSDMVMYFMENYLTKQEIPTDLIDRNVRIDDRKLLRLIMVNKGKTRDANENLSKLKEVVIKGGASTPIVKGFPLEKALDSNNFKSLLYYLGLLTIKGPDIENLRLEIPNEAIKWLLNNYINEKDCKAEHESVYLKQAP